MKPLSDLQPNDCKWPIGDPKKPDFGFCGDRAQTGKPYCACHCKMAYEPKRSAPWIPGAMKSGAETTRGSFHGFGIRDKEPPQADCVDAFAAGGAR